MAYFQYATGIQVATHLSATPFCLPGALAKCCLPEQDEQPHGLFPCTADWQGIVDSGGQGFTFNVALMVIAAFGVYALSM